MYLGVIAGHWAVSFVVVIVAAVVAVVVVIVAAVVAVVVVGDAKLIEQPGVPRL